MPAVVSTLAVVAAIQRVLAVPQIDAWLDRNLRLGTTGTRTPIDTVTKIDDINTTGEQRQ